MQVAIPNHHNHEAQDLLEWTAHQPLGKGLNFPGDIRTYCVVETVISNAKFESLLPNTIRALIIQQIESFHFSNQKTWVAEKKPQGGHV